jgi:hypothetical protein
MFSHFVSGKDLNNYFKNYGFLISFLNYIIQYFPSDFVELQMTSQIILFNIFHRICVLTSSKTVLSKLYTPSVLKYKAFSGSKFVPKYKTS